MKYTKNTYTHNDTNNNKHNTNNTIRNTDNNNMAIHKMDARSRKKRRTNKNNTNTTTKKTTKKRNGNSKKKRRTHMIGEYNPRNHWCENGCGKKVTVKKQYYQNNQKRIYECKKCGQQYEIINRKHLTIKKEDKKWQ